MKEELKQEDKELLLKDLCARLPYGVKCNYLNEDGSLSNDKLLRNITICPLYIAKPNGMVLTGEVKPYLFPLSSMNDEQRKELEGMFATFVEIDFKGDLYVGHNSYIFLSEMQDYFDFLNRNHFDYRNLIGKNLAIDCTNLNIY